MKLKRALWNKWIAKKIIVSLMVLGASWQNPAQSQTIRKPLNWGLGSFQSTFGIGIERAWKISRGNRKIVVAVIDTGADYTHPDLVTNLWRNPGESGFDALGRPKNKNGVDDDHNGYIDDEIGWDFVDQDNKPYDTHGHGTHIAGIIGGNGQHKIHGVSPNVSLMILKYYNPNGTGESNLMNTVRAINYAVKNGARIINYSAGGPSFSAQEYKAIQRAQAKGVLFVSAAGNEKQNADTFHYYPTSYTLDNILSVTAIDKKGKILASSNFGPRTVDVAAPGKNIISSSPNKGFGPMTGTSQATAFVSGLAALIMAASPQKNISFRTVKKIIINSGRKLKTLIKRTTTGRMVDATKAMEFVTKPQTPTVAN